MSGSPSDVIRPDIGADHDLQAATRAVVTFVAHLQEGYDRHDASVTDTDLSADVAWGSPYGATVDGFDRLHAIHQRLKKQGAVVTFRDPSRALGR
jgi:hypothetical protein